MLKLWTDQLRSTDLYSASIMFLFKDGNGLHYRKVNIFLNYRNIKELLVVIILGLCFYWV